MPYDEERDWPQVEREDEVDTAGDQTQQPPIKLTRVITLIFQASPVPVQTGLTI